MISSASRASAAATIARAGGPSGGDVASSAPRSLCSASERRSSLGLGLVRVEGALVGQRSPPVSRRLVGMNGDDTPADGRAPGGVGERRAGRR
jgi:hypothetical protein